MPLPFEFVILGRPVSAQTRRRENLEEWKTRIEGAARSLWHDSELEKGPIAVTLIYFAGRTRFDLDNIPKPVLDSLKGLVYEDDSQITDLICRKRILNGNWYIVSDSVVLNEALKERREFLYIVVELVPEQEIVTWYRTQLLSRANS